MFELEALSEIYEKEILHYNVDVKNSITSGEFVGFTKFSSQSSQCLIIANEKNFHVSCLPPIFFNFKINLDDSEMPDISVNSIWLPIRLLSKLNEKLYSIIIENFPNKFWSCFEYLENDAIKFLTENYDEDIIINLNDIYPLEIESRINEIAEILKKVDDKSSLYVFSKTTNECQICLDFKKGDECFKFGLCSHLVCKQCFLEYFNCQLLQGLIILTCPVCNIELHYNEIKLLVDEQSFKRWETLSLKHCLKSMDDQKMCPKCSIYIAINPDDEFGFCKSCKHTFCIECSETYNGPRCCRYKLKYTTVEEIEDEKMKKKHFFDNKKSDNFISKYFVSCPTCGTVYQKEGAKCFKLICSNCDTQFCFLCMTKLSNKDPSSHFTTNCVKNLSKKDKSNLKVRLTHKGAF